jgi:hypothetical protein
MCKRNWVYIRANAVLTITYRSYFNKTQNTTDYALTTVLTLRRHKQLFAFTIRLILWVGHRLLCHGLKRPEHTCHLIIGSKYATRKAVLPVPFLFTSVCAKQLATGSVLQYSYFSALPHKAPLSERQFNFISKKIDLVHMADGSLYMIFIHNDSSKSSCFHRIQIFV